jgi:hypothetical protein
MMESPKPVNRYWGLVAVHTQLSKKRRTLIPAAIESSAMDSETIVAIAALDILANFGTPEQSTEANNHLVQIAIGDETTWGARMLALNAINDRTLISSAKESLGETSEKRRKSWAKDLPSRYTEYLPRLIERLSNPQDQENTD